MIIFIVESNEQEVTNNDDGTIDMEGDDWLPKPENWDVTAVVNY